MHVRSTMDWTRTSPHLLTSASAEDALRLLRETLLIPMLKGSAVAPKGNIVDPDEY